MDQFNYEEWLKLRKKTECEEGKLCYCGHTYKCSCGDPDQKTFNESVERGAIKLGDPKNGWQPIDKPVEHISQEINKDIINRIFKNLKHEEI